jgi:hypothetical protein
MPKPPPPTQEQIDKAFDVYRMRLSILHELAGKRDHLMRNRMSPSAIMDANASIAQHRTTVFAAREALRELLEKR